MHVILEAVEGPTVGTRVMVRQGQIVRVGRTEWADFSLPDDAELSEVHFELEYGGQGCRLRTQGTAITAVNGKPASEVWLRAGDKVTAGQTTFEVDLPAGTPSPPDPARTDVLDTASPEKGAESAEPKTPQTAAEYCAPIKVGEDAKRLLSDELLPADFLESLIAEELLADAVAFMACWLPKPDAVRWGCACLAELLGDGLNAKDSEALKAALSWAEDSSEKNRRAAEAAAERSGFEGPASWLARAAFWSGGSMTPPDLPEVPPGEGLTAQAVAASLVMAATQGDPLAAKDHLRQFLEKGQAVAKETVLAPGQA